MRTHAPNVEGKCSTSLEPSEAVSTDSTYHVLWAGQFHGVQDVADGKSVRHGLEDEVDYEIIPKEQT